MQHREIAAADTVDVARDREQVATLADRAGDRRDHPLAVRHDRFEPVKGIVQRRPRKVVHRRIDDHERMVGTRLHPDHPRHQHAGEPRDHPPRLEREFDVPVARDPRDHRGIGVERRNDVVGAVGDAEATAEIDAGDGMTARAQVCHQPTDPIIGLLQRGEIAQLAADVQRDPDQVETVQARQSIVHRGDVGDRHPELVAAPPRRDLGMRAAVDVGIDAQHRRRPPALRMGQRGEHLSLFLQFEVELTDAGSERAGEFAVGLADARKDDVRCRDPRVERAPHLAPGNDVGAEPAPGQQVQHRAVRVRLDGKRDAHAWQDRQRRPEPLRCIAQRGGGIDVDGCPHRLGDDGQRHAFGAQDAVPRTEIGHDWSVSGYRECGGSARRRVRRSRTAWIACAVWP